MPESASSPAFDAVAGELGGYLHRRPGRDPESAIKSLAKTMARDATARITDRHLRAVVRTDCYNQMVAVLRHIDQRRMLQRAELRRTRIGFAAAVGLLAIALALSLS